MKLYMPGGESVELRVDDVACPFIEASGLKVEGIEPSLRAAATSCGHLGGGKEGASMSLSAKRSIHTIAR